MKEIKVNATIDQITEFVNSILWKDIKRELSMWKRGFNNEMMAIVDDSAEENPSTANVLMHLGDLNGRQKAVEYMLALPEIFLSMKEEEQREKEEENARRAAEENTE